MKISIVIPVFNAEKIIEELVKKIYENVIQITDDFEVFLIDDCGPDNSWKIIKKLCQKFPFLKGLRLSRNFGQHSAIKAGLDLVTGDCCIVMDCDLQDDPIFIRDLVDHWQRGNDIVYTYKETRKHSFFKNITASIFNKVFNYLTDNKTSKANSNIGSYSLLSRKVVQAFRDYNDYQFHYLMVLRWMGFKHSFVKIKHKKRFQGKSSYTLKKLLEHAIVGIIYQSDKLLRISIYFGFILSFFSLMVIFIVIAKYFYDGFQSGWASLFVLITFFAGITLIAIGVLGIYIGKMFEQVKNRPQYIIDKQINMI